MECKNCKTELTRDEKRGCWRCLNCNPLPKDTPAPPQDEKKYLDVAMTEERVREIVRDELENWHIHKPPATVSEIKETTGMEVWADIRSTTNSADVPIETVENPVETVAEMTYRQQAKALGIKTFGKKKADVLKEIEEKKQAS